MHLCLPTYKIRILKRGAGMANKNFEEIILFQKKPKRRETYQIKKYENLFRYFLALKLVLF